jgi:N-acyl-D-glutamate deacylase
MRYQSVVEPFSSFEAFEELCALSAETGAHMHVCHLNSIAARDAVACVELFRGAQARGLPITIEAYPYGAASTAVGAEPFRHPDWVKRLGAPDASWMELNGKPLDQAKIDELQKSEPGTVIAHFLKPDDDATDQKLLDMSVLYPGAAIAWDAMPWIKGNVLIDGDFWPLPRGGLRASAFNRLLLALHWQVRA